MGMVVDYEGFMYVADSGNDAIRRVSLKDGTTITVDVAAVSYT
jgi:sugar lactone lactonase YvrE